MKTRTLVLVGIGLIAFVIILALTTPASFVASQVNAILPGQVAVDQATGNMWTGEARVRVAPGGGARSSGGSGGGGSGGSGEIVLERVRWRLKPGRLANGQLAFDTSVSSGGVEAKMEIARDGSRWHVQNLELYGDASAFASIFPILGPYRFSGPVTATSTALDGDGLYVWGSVRLEWRDAVTGLSEVRPLGSYRADWRADGSTGQLTVTTLSGALRVDGSGTTVVPSRVVFSGEARAEPSTAAALEPLLNLIGPRKPNGARAIEIRLQ